MVVSNEPGYYEAGAYGIRIGVSFARCPVNHCALVSLTAFLFSSRRPENLLVVVEKKTLGEFGGRAFYGFERLTHIPIQKRLMDLNLLTDVEVAWVDGYHREVWERVGPLMQTERGKRWLREATAPLRKAAGGESSTKKVYF